MSFIPLLVKHKFRIVKSRVNSQYVRIFNKDANVCYWSIERDVYKFRTCVTFKPSLIE